MYVTCLASLGRAGFPALFEKGGGGGSGPCITSPQISEARLWEKERNYPSLAQTEGSLPPARARLRLEKGTQADRPLGISLLSSLSGGGYSGAFSLHFACLFYTATLCAARHGAHAARFRATACRVA